LPVIDISTIFQNDIDYANPIEPSHFGGDKITNNVVNILKGNDYSHQLYVNSEYSDSVLSPSNPSEPTTKEDLQTSPFAENNDKFRQTPSQK
jgi:hypothetical protein